MKEPLHSEICILGAGPGGAMAALFLAQLGQPCTLVDKAVFPRDKICGDALSGKVMEVLKKLNPEMVDRMALQSGFLGSWGVTFVAPNTRELRVPFRQVLDKSQQAPGFIAKRLDFDNFLIEECRKHSSIRILEGVNVTEIRREEGRFILSGNEPAGPLIHSKLVIAADGAQSRFARTIGGQKMEPRHHCAGIRGYFKGVGGLDPDNFIELQFLKDFLPGYFWIFPLPNGMANVGVGMRSDRVSKKKVNLKKRMFEIIEHYPQLKERFRGAELVGDLKGFGLPLGSKKRRLSGQGYMLVGDSGSLIDPFTGEGIGNALYSGMFAAQQAAKCIEAQNFSPEFMKEYDREVWGRLWGELKLGRRMQQMVDYPWLFNLVVNKARKNKVLRDTISCMFEDMDLRARLKNPMFYFKLLFN